MVTTTLSRETSDLVCRFALRSVSVYISQIPWPASIQRVYQLVIKQVRLFRDVLLFFVFSYWYQPYYNMNSYLILFSALLLLTDAGFVQDSVRYAPVYYFDGSSSKYCYPDLPSSSNNNKCRSTFRSKTISFVEFDKCGSFKVYTYWLWYGRQKGCISFDKGHGDDWEHVSVFVKQRKVRKVIYYQHSGHYTRRRGTFKKFGERPVVYIGKVAHGSYHAECDGKCGVKDFFTKGCLGSVNYCQGGCGYWDDFRNPGPKLDSYTLRDLRPGAKVNGISRPKREVCVKSCKGAGTRLLTTAGCWQNKA